MDRSYNLKSITQNDNSGGLFNTRIGEMTTSHQNKLGRVEPIDNTNQRRVDESEDENKEGVESNPMVVLGLGLVLVISGFIFKKVLAGDTTQYIDLVEV